MIDKSTIKMITILSIIGLGFIFVIVGVVIYQTQPPIRDSGDFPIVFDENNKTYDVTVIFSAPEGIMEDNAIYTTIMMKVSEKTNATKAQVYFPNAKVRDQDIHEDPKVGRVVDFKFLENQSGVMKYQSKPLLIYNVAGIHNMKLKITNENSTFDKEFEVLQVDSKSNHDSEKRVNESNGLTFLVMGISLISIAPTFTTVITLVDKFRNMRKNEFYYDT